MTSGASATNSAASRRLRSARPAPAGVDPHVAVVAPAQLLQGLPERRDGGLTFWIVSGPIHEHADAPHALRLLRPRAGGHVPPCRREA